ncbi:hypothetical protein [Nonomuraea rhizosphaerae]|uniref:hypothetical protein n=1 Tax=Nonomuraea rhizosphaerae TaxID=2665663 RepID=UPI001C5E8706|nr:hypothetical protein [Nonomuraea rhizosphaerae]
MIVREHGWFVFVDEVLRDRYRPDKVIDRCGWVQLEIHEGFLSEAVPTGWRPKMLKISGEVLATVREDRSRSGVRRPGSRLGRAPHGRSEDAS